MLKFNINRIMQLRGIARPYGFLVRNGFTRSTATNFTSGRATEIKVEHFQKLCLLLNCSPNDFFEWETTAKSPSLNDNHALNSLIREKHAPSLAEIVKDMPIEKMEEIGRMLKDLKEK